MFAGHSFEEKERKPCCWCDTIYSYFILLWSASHSTLNQGLNLSRPQDVISFVYSKGKQPEVPPARMSNSERRITVNEQSQTIPLPKIKSKGPSQAQFGAFD